MNTKLSIIITVQNCKNEIHKITNLARIIKILIIYCLSKKIIFIYNIKICYLL